MMLIVFGNFRYFSNTFSRGFDYGLLNGYFGQQWRSFKLLEVLTGSHLEEYRPKINWRINHNNVQDWLSSILYRRAMGPSLATISSPLGIRSFLEKLTYLFNKLRNDKKHRKRAFPKRGYWRRTHAMLRKDNRIKYAYALEGIDYEMIEKLERGEIPDIKTLKR
ncbi:hypothetical protein BEWA_031790 [Theileria equi strain WA]|uniref:Uncharacterized protein n=1 Tax=Theileria equi strain WA TaxID=1537102 RepID=L0AZ84_THEEQ|nr:hypothetical protein BEWA_031790 [Theileria equi strain WA]AFZ80326.1 hypothetical protein BEWA_031790 [Theileria equi strain WA]|eukprot:XP_004829992.1 hypothetical protein BEWA_031790 [Theileria equi strain WA]